MLHDFNRIPMACQEQLVECPEYDCEYNHVSGVKDVRLLIKVITIVYLSSGLVLFHPPARTASSEEKAKMDLLPRAGGTRSHLPGWQPLGELRSGTQS